MSELQDCELFKLEISPDATGQRAADEIRRLRAELGNAKLRAATFEAAAEELQRKLAETQAEKGGAMMDQDQWRSEADLDPELGETLAKTTDGELGTLDYIADSPPPEYGGFHPTTVAAAKWAADEIRTMRKQLADAEGLIHTCPNCGAHCKQCLCVEKEHSRLMGECNDLRAQLADANAMAERLAEALKLARDYVVDKIAENKRNYGDRLVSHQQLDIDYLVKIDAALAAYDAQRKADGKEQP